MDKRTNTDTYQNVGKYFLKSIQHLFLRISQTLFYCQVGRINVYAACCKDKILNVFFHVQFLDDRTAGHCNRKAKHNINNGYLCTENTNEQYKAP